MPRIVHGTAENHMGPSWFAAGEHGVAEYVHLTEVAPEAGRVILHSFRHKPGWWGTSFPCRFLEGPCFIATSVEKEVLAKVCRVAARLEAMNDQQAMALLLEYAYNTWLAGDESVGEQ